jgi:hypothetical protein
MLSPRHFKFFRVHAAILRTMTVGFETQQGDNVDIVLAIIRAIVMLGFVAAVMAILAGLFMVVFGFASSIGRDRD